MNNDCKSGSNLHSFAATLLSGIISTLTLRCRLPTNNNISIQLVKRRVFLVNAGVDKLLVDGKSSALGFQHCTPLNRSYKQNVNSSVQEEKVYTIVAVGRALKLGQSVITHPKSRVMIDRIPTHEIMGLAVRITRQVRRGGLRT